MPKVTWLTPYADLWKREYEGEMPMGQAARALAPVRKDLGDVEALVRFEWYLRSTPAQYASVSRFASVHGRYAADAKPEVSAGGVRPLTMGRVIG